MGEIKSAREIAEEKLKKIGDVTEEERLSWKYVPEGERLAARYLKDGCNLSTELGAYEEKARQHVARRAREILVRNINLPVNDAATITNKKAMEGLSSLIKDKAATENIFSNLRRIFDHYTGQGKQQMQQAYETLKAEFTDRVQQAMQQQMGTSSNGAIDIERQPEFRQEWQRLQAQMEGQYTNILAENKRALLELS
ncbi:hypothetical protein ACFLV2_01255 [Chloroflexota bacterium]